MVARVEHLVVALLAVLLVNQSDGGRSRQACEEECESWDSP